MRNQLQILIFGVITAIIGVLSGCNIEERRQCEQLSNDTQEFLTKTHELVESMQSKANLFALLNPAIMAKTEAMEEQNDSIADRWEKATDSCKERVRRDIAPVLAELEYPEHWTPDATVKSRNKRREEAEQEAREEAERKAREAQIESNRKVMRKSLRVTLVEIRSEPRDRYSSYRDYRLPVRFENLSQETIIATSGRMTCFNNLDSSEGSFYTTQTDINLAPGASKIVTLVSDDIQNRWLKFSKCTKQVWQHEAIRFHKRGLVRAPLKNR